MCKFHCKFHATPLSSAHGFIFLCHLIVWFLLSMHTLHIRSDIIFSFNRNNSLRLSRLKFEVKLFQKQNLSVKPSEWKLRPREAFKAWIWVRSRVRKLRISEPRPTLLLLYWFSNPRKVKQLLRLSYNLLLKNFWHFSIDRFLEKCTQVILSKFEPNIRKKSSF